MYTYIRNLLFMNNKICHRVRQCKELNILPSVVPVIVFDLINWHNPMASVRFNNCPIIIKTSTGECMEVIISLFIDKYLSQ